MHPALRKGPLFYTKKIIFHFFRKTHPPFHFLPVQSVSSIVDSLWNRSQQGPIHGSSVFCIIREGTSPTQWVWNQLPQSVFEHCTIFVNPRQCLWHEQYSLWLEYTEMSCTFQRFVPGIWARQVGRYTKEGLILIYTFEKPITHRL